MLLCAEISSLKILLFPNSYPVQAAAIIIQSYQHKQAINSSNSFQFSNSSSQKKHQQQDQLQFQFNSTRIQQQHQNITSQQHQLQSSRQLLSMDHNSSLQKTNPYIFLSNKIQYIPICGNKKNPAFTSAQHIQCIPHCNTYFYIVSNSVSTHCKEIQHILL